MKIKSAIFFKEVIENTDLKNHNEAEQFYPVFIYNNRDNLDGIALFTKHEIKKAMSRGNRNVEDINVLKSYYGAKVTCDDSDTTLKPKWWERLLFWL